MQSESKWTGTAGERLPVCVRAQLGLPLARAGPSWSEQGRNRIMPLPAHAG